MRLEDALAPWLQEQRWFAGKGRTLCDLSVVADTEVVAGDPALRHLIVLVSHGATADHYQLFLGLRHDLGVSHYRQVAEGSALAREPPLLQQPGRERILESHQLDLSTPRDGFPETTGNGVSGEVSGAAFDGTTGYRSSFAPLVVGRF